jgi:hypothetical protein
MDWVPNTRDHKKKVVLVAGNLKEALGTPIDLVIPVPEQY